VVITFDAVVVLVVAVVVVVVVLSLFVYSVQTGPDLGHPEHISHLV